MTEKDMHAFAVPHEQIVAEFRRNIHFRHFQPEMTMRNGNIGIEDYVARLDLFNTIIDDSNPVNTDAFLHGMTRMSTLANGYMINMIVKRMNPGGVFLNVGTFEGYTMFSGMAGNPHVHSIGVDNFSQFGGPKERFFQGYRRYRNPLSDFYNSDYVKYFRDHHRKPIGFYIYDGPHDYDNQYNGLKLAEPYFGPDTLILVDDTNGEVERKATFDFIDGRTDKYRVLLDERTANNEHPTWWNGVMLIGCTG